MVYKAAITGLGRIASLLESDSLREKPCTHAGAITANPGLFLCAGADSAEDRRQLFAETWKVPVYADTETMLLKERPHILHIATHPDSHWHYCSLAAQYGVSVVVCEKPLADTLGRAKKIAALHESGRITVITNHERRYAADYALARKILAGGDTAALAATGAKTTAGAKSAAAAKVAAGATLGPVTSVRGKLYVGKTRRLLDVLWHDGTHLADAAMFLTGAVLKHHKTIGSLTRRSGTAYLLGHLKNPTVPMSSVRRTAGDGQRDAGDKQHTADALPFLLEVGAGRDHLVFELEFSCERGKLVIGNGIFEVWESRESPYAEGFKSLVKCKDGFTGPTGYFSNMAADALACAAALQKPGGDKPIPLSSAADGLRVIRYLRSIKAWR